MKKNFTITLITAAFVCSGVFAQTQPAKKATVKPKTPTPEKVMSSTEADIKQAESMKTWMAYMTPGAMHDMLAKCSGDWKEDITLWMTPGAPPLKNEASCVNTMIMENRYQQSIHKSTMNGMPFEGTGILGFDNGKKVFVSTWIDNMGTGIMYLEGKWDAANQSIHFSGKSVDPMTGKDQHVREEFKIIDDNHQTLEMYMTQNAKEYKSMEIKFSR